MLHTLLFTIGQDGLKWEKHRQIKQSKMGHARNVFLLSRLSEKETCVKDRLVLGAPHLCVDRKVPFF